MNEQRIIKLDSAKFLVFWTESKDDALLLDFNPIIDQFQLSGNFCLLHWQAKPFGLRRFGVYDRVSDHYFSTDNAIYVDSISINRRIETIQIDERQFQTKPTAVIAYHDSIIKITDKGFAITQATL